MKTKLFSLFIAVFLFSFSGKAQTNAKTAVPVYPIITLIGSGNGGWTSTAETPLLTSDGITYTLVDKVLTDGELKFREGKCWPAGADACPPGSVTNPYGWGPTDAQFAIDKGWPSGTNAAPVDGGKNIFSKAGSWTITFNRVQGTWSFVPGTPLPVIKLVGTAVSAPGGVALTTADGITFTAKKVTLVPGSAKITIDGTSYGPIVTPGFPTGTATDLANSITVTTTGKDYDVSFDYSTAKYTFTLATFPQVAIIGAGAGGWPPNPQPVEYVDQNIMNTTDGITYTLNNVPLITDNIKFRQDNSWSNNWGGLSFPTGPTDGSKDIAATVGNYNVTFNKTTGAYAFAKNTYAIVGDGVGGWPGDPGNPGPNDVHQLSTVDGVNYTKNNLVTFNGGAKFRPNNTWSGDWGGNSFPSGTKTGSNIPTTAGTYNLTVNVLTGAYTFTNALAVTKFDAKSFKAYPNPTRGTWNITSGNDDITSIQVYDVQGKAVYTNFGASKEVSVNASELSRGVYYAKVSTANGTSTLKLVKE